MVKAVHGLAIVHLTLHLPTLTCSPFFCFVFEVECAQWYIKTEHSALGYRVGGLRPTCVPFYLWWPFSKTKVCNLRFFYMHGVTCRYQHTQSQGWLVMMENVKISSFIIENFLGPLHRYVAHQCNQSTRVYILYIDNPQLIIYLSEFRTQTI